MKRRLGYSRIMLTVSVAVFMITSFITILGSSASSANEITLSCEKKTASAGERVTVTVGFEPDKKGAAGFTVNLCYDPDKLEVFVPTENEAETLFNAHSRFSVITNYTRCEGVVRIVGADLGGENIINATDLAVVAFNVKNGASGDTEFYTEVETLVAAEGSSYVNVPYSAGKASLKIKGAPEPEKVTSASVTTTPEPVTTTPAVTSTVKETTAAAADTTTTAPVTAVTVPGAATSQVTTEAPAVTSVTETPPVSVTTSEKSVEVPEDKALFTYSAEGRDFNSEEKVYCRIPLKKYITDKSRHYDVRITVQSTGNANCGLSLISEGKYRRQVEKLRTRSEVIWTIEDIEPSKITSDIYVDLYYLKANSEFRVNSVEFTERSETVTVNAVPETEQPESSAESVSQQGNAKAEITDESSAGEESSSRTESTGETMSSAVIEDNGTPGITAGSDDDSSVNDNDTKDADTKPADNTGAESVDTASGSKTDAAAAETPSGTEGTNDTGTQTDIGEDLSGNSDTPDNSTNETGAAEPEAQKIEKTVIRASQAAGGSDASKNVQTGTSGSFAKNLLMILSAGYILWSLFTVLFNRIHEKE